MIYQPEALSPIERQLIEPPSSRLHQAICLVLSDRADQVDWESLTPLDWTTMLSVARRERVAPLLYWKLGRFLAGDASQCDPLVAFRQRLVGDYYQSAANNQMIWSELARLWDHLRGESIAVILLKGLILAARLYSDVALRPMGDLDLLVRREDLGRVLLILEKAGYTGIYPRKSGLARVASDLTEHHTILMGGPGRRVVIDMHWALVGGEVDRRSPPMEWFWETARESELPADWLLPATKGFSRSGPYQILSLSLGASLLYSCAHLMFQHPGIHSLLAWFYDIHLLVTQEYKSIDWGEVAEVACRCRWADAVRLALLATQARFETRLPETLLAVLQAQREEDVLRTIADQAFTRDEREALSLISLRIFRPWVWARLGLAQALPSPEYLRWRYRPNPAWLWPFYYLKRWWDLFYYALKAFVRRIA